MTCPSCGGPQSGVVVRFRWSVLLGVYAVGFMLAYTLGGSLLDTLLEGLQRSRLPIWKAALPITVLAVALAGTWVRWRQTVCERCRATRFGWAVFPAGVRGTAAPVDETRRVFLWKAGGVVATAATALGALGAVIARNRRWVPVGRDFFYARVEKTAPVFRPEWQGAQVKSYRRLGRTNALVSDISLGSAGIDDVSVAQRAIERGITYFDTSPDYANTSSEHVLGQAIKGARRDKIFLATKFCAPDGHLPIDTPVPQIIAAVEGSLRRLQTDYVDLIHIHSCNHVERLLAPNIHTAFDRLKEQGKVRFLGVSCHSPNLEAVANAAIDSGRFDVMMMAYHFGMWPNFGHILEKARAHDVGVVAMKTLKGAKHAQLAKFELPAGAYSQAAFRWVLSNPAVSCLVISIWTHAQIDEYLAASGAAVQTSDVAVLRRYDELIAGDYCQPHCGECLDACPWHLPINDILRYRMYFADYGWEKEGMRQYAKLAQNAALCVGCAAPCAGTCPTGVRIPAAMRDAHEKLSWPT